MTIHNDIGGTTGKTRALRNLLQEQLALECEMSVSYLRRIEHGAANPTINELSRIAETLGAEFRNPIHIPELPDAAQRSGGSDKP